MFTRGTMQREPLRYGQDSSSGSGLTNSEVVKPVLIGLSEGLCYLPRFCACCIEEHRSLQSNMTNSKPLGVCCSGEDDF